MYLPRSKNLLVGDLLAFSNGHKILSMQRDMTTTMPAGLEPADFVECSHFESMPAGIEPAGRPKKSYHEHTYETQKNVQIHVLHPSMAEAITPTCRLKRCIDLLVKYLLVHPCLLDCGKHHRLGVRACWSTTEIASFALK